MNMIRQPETGDCLLDHLQRCECDQCRAARNAERAAFNHQDDDPDDTEGFYWGTAFPNSEPGEWVGGRRGPFSTWEAADGHARDNGYDDEKSRRFLVIRREE